MVAGILYCGVDGNTDPKEELAAVKDSLTTAVESVKMVRVRTFARPKTAYRNEFGTSILQSIESMRSEMRTNEKAMRDEIDKLRIKAEAHERECKTNTQGFEERIRVLTQESNILRPLRNIALDIRKLFLLHPGVGWQTARPPRIEFVTGPPGRFWRPAPPCYPQGATPHPCPRLAPSKFGWEETGPRMGGGVGRADKIPPPWPV
ncbi:hypothetical protein HOY80DRAFT_974835 [Tuber brumale]|nr:hypothetical protein HOY80DRAFT_974835 [Tuber brumale]